MLSAIESINSRIKDCQQVRELADKECSIQKKILQESNNELFRLMGQKKKIEKEALCQEEQPA